MKIKNVNILNMDILYPMIQSKFNNKVDRLKEFGRNLPQLYNQISIGFDIENITEYEYLFLKSFCSSCTKIENESINIFGDVYNGIDSLESSASLMMGTCKSIEDSSKNNQNNVYGKYKFLPASLLSGNCKAVFTGEHVASILGLDPCQFFWKNIKSSVKRLNESEIELADYNEINEEEITNALVSNFLQSFYQFMTNKIQYIDPISDGFVSMNFLAKSKGVKINTIINPYFFVDFLNDSLDVTSKKFEDFKRDNLYSSMAAIMNDTYITFNMNTSFYTYYKFFQYMPVDRFISQESFRIPFNKSYGSIIQDPYIEKGCEDFKLRINKRIDDFSAALKKEIQDDKSNRNYLKYYMSTRNDIDYRYNLRLSLSDVNSIMKEMLSDNSMDRETLDSINSIVRFSNIIYNNIKK